MPVGLQSGHPKSKNQLAASRIKLQQKSSFVRIQECFEAFGPWVGVVDFGGCLSSSWPSHFHQAVKSSLQRAAT